MDKTALHSRSIEKEFIIKAPIERVFRALTEKEELEHWFVTNAEVDLHPGGALKFEWGTGTSNFGKVISVQSPQHFRYTWEGLEPRPTTITFDLTREDTGTRLHLTHSGIGTGNEWNEYYNTRNGGWSIHLQHLVDWLEMGKEREW